MTKLGTKEINEIIELYLKGAKPREIANVYRVTKATIYSHISKYKYQKKKLGEKFGQEPKTVVSAEDPRVQVAQEALRLIDRVLTFTGI